MATPDNTETAKNPPVKAEGKDAEGKSQSGDSAKEAGDNGKESGEAEAKGGDKSAKADEGKDKEKKHPLTWERSWEIVKLIATVWVALLGSVVSMQYNERQHQLSRIEGIAQMLPHMGQDDSKNASGDHMARDGAIWAVFRAANDPTMLRDLASLFPQDIYRVVSSIALAGGLDRDPDALVALQVASEKLATIYSADPKRAELASKLYAQALTLKERKPDDTSPLRVVDLSGPVDESSPTDDQMAGLVKGMNNLADLHLKDSDSSKEGKDGNPKKKSGSTHWQSKQLYLRARQLGLPNKDDQVQQQVMRADLALAGLYVHDGLADDAYKYLKEALTIETAVTGKDGGYLKALDKDGDGYAALSEMSVAVDHAKERLQEILVKFADKGASIKE